MTRAPIGDDEAPGRLHGVITEWAALWPGDSLVGPIEHRDEPDGKGHYHWLVRLKGDEKSVITIWFSLRQRSVHVETELMPAPAESHEALYRYLLVKNHEMRELHLAIGPEDGVYLVTQIPRGELSVERLDELVGATLTYVDELYPTAMSLGLGSIYRRRTKH